MKIDFPITINPDAVEHTYLQLARQLHQVLADEGLVVTEPGRGTFVAEQAQRAVACRGPVPAVGSAD